ncbi:MAG: hypothetical protein QOI98_1849 [Solirubrobacteraceae bacterium]|nr:hypothetical protein [Solirubrobacteraceae bacterium]
MSTVAVVAGLLAGLVAGILLAIRLRRPPLVAQAVISDPREPTVIEESGAVRSTQAADLEMPVEALDAIWTPMHLERLARAYWRFLSRCTLGLIRVVYTDRERFVVFLARPFVLLRFRAPEYEMDAQRGIVRWRIERGLLVSRRGRGSGYLQIDVKRREGDRPGQARVHVEVEVANFYPAIASAAGRWVYRETQSRIHVLVTHGFLRSLARLDLPESRVGLLDVSDVPDPPPAGG